MEKLLTLVQAADALGMSRRAVQKLVNAYPPELGSYRGKSSGRAWVRVGEEHLNEFLAARERTVRRTDQSNEELSQGAN